MIPLDPMCGRVGRAADWTTRQRPAMCGAEDASAFLTVGFFASSGAATSGAGIRVRKESVDGREVLPRIPLRRLGTPADIADMVVLFASEQARWMTGQVVQVAGGHAL